MATVVMQLMFMVTVVTQEKFCGDGSNAEQNLWLWQ